MIVSNVSIVSTCTVNIVNNLSIVSIVIIVSNVLTQHLQFVNVMS